jgi:hypothetical protein
MTAQEAARRMREAMRQMCKFSAAVMVLAAGLAVAAGAGPQAKPEPAPAFGVRGKIEKITAPNERQAENKVLGQVLVAGKKEKDTETDRAVAIVMADTRLLREEKGKRVPAKFEELKPGQRVEVKFKPGPRILIYPTQAGATELVILPAEK